MGSEAGFQQDCSRLRPKCSVTQRNQHRTPESIAALPGEGARRPVPVVRAPAQGRQGRPGTVRIAPPPKETALARAAWASTVERHRPYTAEEVAHRVCALHKGDYFPVDVQHRFPGGSRRRTGRREDPMADIPVSGQHPCFWVPWLRFPWRVNHARSQGVPPPRPVRRGLPRSMVNTTLLPVCSGVVKIAWAAAWPNAG